MTRLTVATLLTAIVIMAAGPPAIADIEIAPGSHGSTVVLKGERARSHHGGSHGGKSGTHAGKQLNYGCKTDRASSTYGCRTWASGTPAPARRALTQGDILEAVKEIGLPSLQVRIQPATATLVNIQTIFFTEPKPFKRNVDLLGYDVDLVAKPIRYRWFHGDGTSTSTTKPGKAYPSMDVTYRYRKPAASVHPRVDVTYRVTYRIDGGNWATLDQTLTADGPIATLRVKEAAPVLTKTLTAPGG